MSGVRCLYGPNESNVSGCFVSAIRNAWTKPLRGLPRGNTPAAVNTCDLLPKYCNEFAARMKHSVQCTWTWLTDNRLPEIAQKTENWDQPPPDLWTPLPASPLLPEQRPQPLAQASARAPWQRPNRGNPAASNLPLIWYGAIPGRLFFELTCIYIRAKLPRENRGRVFL
jgi:hypothetical protein